MFMHTCELSSCSGFGKGGYFAGCVFRGLCGSYRGVCGLGGVWLPFGRKIDFRGILASNTGCPYFYGSREDSVLGIVPVALYFALVGFL